MTSYLKRAQSALQEFLRGRHESSPAPQTAPPDSAGQTTGSISRAPVPVGPNLVLADGRIGFVDEAKAAEERGAWLDALDAAITHDAPLSAGTSTIFGNAIRSTTGPLPDEAASERLLGLLRPRTGLSARLGDLLRAGVIGIIVPDSALATRTDRDTEPHALATIRFLERLLTETSLTGERFGSMLREVGSPELLVLALLLQDSGNGRLDPEVAVRTAQPAFDYLRLSVDARRTIEFLIHHQMQMSLLALRQDTGDPTVISTFGAQFSTEEQLKLLCLLTVADLGAAGPDALTPWKAELLWRLFVDTYNHMTMAYGDEVIDSHEAALAALKANRPHDISDSEMASFLEGLPRRYLTLFDPDSIYQHVRLWRNIGPEDVHFFLNRKADVWELTVVTLDKPYLFSNICGVLSFLDLDILRGYALTSRSSLVLDVFRFTDHKGCRVRPSLDPLLSDVVAGRVDIRSRLEEKARQSSAELAAHTAPVIYFDNESSQRYTILELVAGDAPGLLHRISRVISAHGCVVDLVLISTEGSRAIDVFHVRKGSAKLTDADELSLTEDFERMFDEGPQSSIPKPGSPT